MKWLTMFMLFVSLAGYSLDLEVQGHRGNRAVRPENTLEGFAKAIEAGVPTLELDILVTADNQLIIHHDFFVNQRLCSYLNGTEISKQTLIRSLTLSEIKLLDAGSKTDPAFPNQTSVPGAQIPTLQELFDWINNSTHPNAKLVRLNLELKRDLRFPDWTLPPEKLADAITTQVRRNGFSSRVYYSSFDPEVLAAIRKVDPKAETGFIFSSESLEVAKLFDPQGGMDLLIQIAQMLQVDVLSPEHRLLRSKEDVLYLQKEGFRVVPWTVNDPKRWEELINMEVNGVISDDPEALLSFIQKEKAK